MLLLDMQIPTTKQETLPKGVGVAKFDFTKTFRNQLFCTCKGIASSILITNNSESILKSKIMNDVLKIFFYFLYV